MKMYGLIVFCVNNVRKFYTFCEPFCPIKWPAGRCEDSKEIYDEELNKYSYPDSWADMPISRLLALPERKEE